MGTMGQPTIYLCTPTHDGRVTVAYHTGCVRTSSVFNGRIAFAMRHGPLLPRNRDMLTDGFLDGPATHMLCVDSDIGFGPEQIQALLDLKLPFVAGTYSKKQANREIPADYTGDTMGGPRETVFANGTRGPVIDDPLWKSKHVPAGFMLLERGTVERMAGAYRQLQYQVKGFGLITGLWSPEFAQGVSYAGEDVAFCRRWTALGGEIWMHRGVVLEHHGDMVYLPDEADTTPDKADRKPMRPTPEFRKDPNEGAAQAAPVPTGANGVVTKMEGTLPVHIHPDVPS